ncbi:flagellar hook capping FlgD N-terminal domain-containing protein [Pacificoceanicola onchidii]|uniref:flagellar hook capping FlgD N-terminal domain-containing protein n=1 Tax=Pacificoceanicola onchidii TaxID=2562685 RepID=UPI0010A66375|nr:flagellar hook capping FlgD N-terminal domain-containing protein [Pacificoceanicola onchidii]
MVDAIAPTTATTAGSPTSQTSNSRSALSSDFDTFVQMLTVQVQNQDPLNPIDSSDYASQLATFSSVEQQILTNDLLKEMGAKLAGNALQQAADWIGQEALTRSPVFFSDSPIAIRAEYAENATHAKLMVKNSAGETIQTFELDDLPEDIMWTGADADGNLLPVGTYSFQIEQYKGEEVIEISTPQAYSRIIEVRANGDDVMVRLSDGSEVPPSMITGLRSPTT